MTYVLMCGGPDVRTPYAVIQGPLVNLEDLKGEWIKMQVGPMPIWSKDIETGKYSFQPTSIKTMTEYSRELRGWRWKASLLKAKHFIGYLVTVHGFVNLDFIQSETEPLMEFD